MASTNLLVNSHYKMPWIVWKKEYSVSIPASMGYVTTSFPHGLPFTPLLVGSWSNKANFQPSYDLTVDVPGGSTCGQVPLVCQVSADATNINIMAINNVDSAPVCYLRLMAFAPPDNQGEVTPVDYNSPFRYNSKYRYQKIFMAGRATKEVAHGLGYIPQARIWAGSLSNANYAEPAGGVFSDQSLYMTESQNLQFYYHIYLDKML